MNEEILYRYMKHQVPPGARCDSRLLESDPANRGTAGSDEPSDETLALIAPELEDMHERSMRRTSLRGRLVRWSAAAAAAVVLCVGSWYAADHNIRESSAGVCCVSKPQTPRAVHALGRHRGVAERRHADSNTLRPLRVGNGVSGSPGEALFEVKHDAEHPFIVETYACDVEVLGTRFDVAADADAGTFSRRCWRGAWRSAASSRASG